MDTTLVLAAKRGDQDAFATLYHEFRDRLRRWAHGYWIPGAERADVMQHAWIGLWKAIQAYDGRTPFLAFAKMCVKRELVNVLKMARRQKHFWHLTALSLEAECPWIEDAERTVLDVYVDRTAPDVGEIVLGPPRNATPEELVAWAEEHWGLRLSDLEREVLRLRLEGCSYHEVVQQIRGGYKTVDNAVQRIRKKIRKALNGD